MKPGSTEFSALPWYLAVRFFLAINGCGSKFLTPYCYTTSISTKNIPITGRKLSLCDLYSQKPNFLCDFIYILYVII